MRLLVALLVWVFAILTLSAGQVPSQKESHTHHANVGWVPREILERPTTLRDGIGKSQVVVTTSSRQAMSFHNQGLSYLHGYVWIEAARSFNQALRHDSELAMAYLGLSYAYSGLEDAEAARAMFVKAESLASRADDLGRHRIEIRGKQLQAIADPTNVLKHLEYKKAIDAALATWPDDVELWLLRGNAEEPRPDGRGQRGRAPRLPSTRLHSSAPRTISLRIII